MEAASPYPQYNETNLADSRPLSLSPFACFQMGRVIVSCEGKTWQEENCDSCRARRPSFRSPFAFFYLRGFHQKDIGFDGEAGNQTVLVAAHAFLIENDLYWHALYDLGEIAGGIFWREQGEDGA